MRAPESATRVQVVVSDRGAEYSRAFDRIDEAAGFLARLAGDSSPSATK